MKNILAIQGSTRQNATSNLLISTIARLFQSELTVIVYNQIASLPHFNPDEDLEKVANEVTDFRQQIQHADGVLICTPEYAHGVPGTLKNAIDWTVSTADLYQKPTALITASTDGSFGHTAMLEILKAIGAQSAAHLNLCISFIKTKVSKEGEITHAETLASVRQLVDGLIKTMI